MASVQVYRSGNVEYVRIVESYRDPETKKPKIRVLKNLGRKEDLEKDHPNFVLDLKRQFQESRTAQKKICQEKVRDYLKEILHAPDFFQGVLEKNYGYLVYQEIWNRLNLDYFFRYRQKADSQVQFSLRDSIFNLTMLQLLDPSSKRRACQQQSYLYGIQEIELHQIYRSLAFLGNQKKHLLNYLNKRITGITNRNLRVCFYDVTTFYFESVEANTLKNFGYSKDNKVNQVQVVLGLLIDQNGIPVYYDLFPGNTSDFKTLQPVLQELKASFGIHKIIITADRGLNSKSNLALLRSMGYDYVMAYKIRTSTRAIQNMVTDCKDYVSLNKDLSYKVTALQQETTYLGEKQAWEDTFVLTYSRKRAEKDRSDRARLVEKAVKLAQSKSRLKSEMKKGGKKYIQLSMEAVALEVDERKIADDSRFDGFYGIVCSDKTLGVTEILATYRGLWKIEQSFRVMKTNLEARPMYVWSEASIQGHIALCYIALTMERLLEYLLNKEKVDLSTAQIQDALRSAKVNLLQRGEACYFIKNQVSDSFQQILKALHVADIPTAGSEKQIRLKVYTK